jgi:hypothetical protein
VYLEVHEQNKIISLRTGLRVAGSAQLAGQVAGILQLPGCCQLHGPAKLLANGHAAAVQLADGEATVTHRLRRTHEDADEFCDSIDRY